MGKRSQTLLWMKVPAMQLNWNDPHCFQNGTTSGPAGREAQLHLSRETGSSCTRLPGYSQNKQGPQLRVFDQPRHQLQFLSYKSVSGFLYPSGPNKGSWDSAAETRLLSLVNCALCYRRIHMRDPLVSQVHKELVSTFRHQVSQFPFRWW